jgi:hypothetical protein
MLKRVTRQAKLGGSELPGTRPDAGRGSSPSWCRATVIDRLERASDSPHGVQPR